MSNTWAQFPTTAAGAPNGELGIGPLVLTVPSQPGGLERVREILARYLEGQRDQAWGTRWYEHQASVGIDRSMIAWSPRAAPSRALEVHVEITQSACDRLGLEASVDLLRELRGLGATATRIDGHLDDRQGLTSPATVDAAVDANHLRTRVRRQSCRAIKVAGTVETVYIGSRQSGRMLRVYNGDKLHGAGTGTRWELEHHGRDAERFAELVAGAPVDEYRTTLIEGMRGHCDFVDRTDRGIHAERAPMLEWWAALVGSVQRLVLRWPSPVEAIARKARWLEQAVAPTLALVAGYHGGAQRAAFNQRMGRYLRHLLAEGAARLTVERYDLLEVRSRTNLATARWMPALR